MKYNKCVWNTFVPLPRVEVMGVTCRAGSLCLQKADFLAEEDQTSIGEALEYWVQGGRVKMTRT